METMEVTEDSNSSSGSSDEENNEDLQKAEELEKEIDVNKYNYDCHVTLVELYKKLGDLNSMRAAYQRFHSCFPLTPEIWLTWLQTEMSLATSEAEKKGVFDLFDEAVQDYLSVKLWIEYAQYSIGVGDLDCTRSILEKGLQTAGLHCSEGSLLWDTLRELESAHISFHSPNSEEWICQVNKLAVVFKRQLSVPLIGMENTYEEWEKWVKSVPDGVIKVDNTAVEWGYKAALQLLEKYTPFEDRLLSCSNNDELYDTYKTYVNSVLEPPTAVCVYERAVAQLCLYPQLWLEYSNFCLKLGEMALSVINRAVRNCPWSEELWVNKLRIMEKQNCYEDKVMKAFELGMASISPPGLELWLAYIEYVTRVSNSTEKVDKLLTQACQQLGHEGDPSFKLSRWHCRILAKRGDMSTVRKTWNAILQNPGCKSYIFWLEYINLEKHHGEPHRVQNLFKKSVHSCSDFPQYLADEWMMYNREFGKLDDILECAQEIRKIQFKYESQSFEKQPTLTEKKNNLRSEGKKRKIEFNDNRESKKVAKHGTEIVSTGHVEKDSKKCVFVSNLHSSVSEQVIKQFFPNAVNVELHKKDKFGKKLSSNHYGYVQFATEEEVMVALARDRELLDGRPIFISELKADRDSKKVFKYATTTEKNKLFVRGLPINKTKEEIEEIFKKYGAVDVRLVLHRSGRPKGLAYVEFRDEEAAKQALKETDNLEIEGHKITVAISAPPPKANAGQKPGQGEPTRHARSRLQVPFVPRALQVKSDEKNKKENGDSKPSSSKSNADFRNMFLNVK